MSRTTHFGMDGAAEFLNSFIGEADASRIFLVCKPHSFQSSGARAFLTEDLVTRMKVFSDFSPNPKVEDVVAGVEHFRKSGAQALIAVGGGSALDMGKLIHYFGSTGKNILEHLKNPSVADASCIPMLAVPTTSGSGSEATHFAVVYQGQTKYSVDGPSMIPEQVLLVPEFTYSLSAYQTACTGMDALAEGVESLWAKGATVESRGYAREAVDLALQHLVAAVNTPNPENRAGMMRAANLAGRAINISKTTAPHAYSYILTSTFGIPHGHAVGLLLPHFVDYHVRHGVIVDGVRGAFLRDLLGEIGLAHSLEISFENLFQLLQGNVNQERLGNNPIRVSDAFLEQLCRFMAGEAQLNQ